MILEMKIDEDDDIKKKLFQDENNEDHYDYERIYDIKLEFNYNLPPNVDKIIPNKEMK